MATTKRKTVKKAKPPVKKKPVAKKKSATTKTPAKKKTAVKKKPAAKKKASAKKTVITKKAVVKKKPVKKRATPKKSPARKSVTKRITKKEQQPMPVAPEETNLPPVEEKSPELSTTVIPAPEMDKKSSEKAALRHYDNHHIKLSKVPKGGIKPAGKKPLW